MGVVEEVEAKESSSSSTIKKRKGEGHPQKQWKEEMEDEVGTAAVGSGDYHHHHHHLNAGCRAQNDVFSFTARHLELRIDVCCSHKTEKLMKICHTVRVCIWGRGNSQRVSVAAQLEKDLASLNS